jgi:hypothetical protein
MVAYMVIINITEKYMTIQGAGRDKEDAISDAIDQFLEDNKYFDEDDISVADCIELEEGE